MDYRLRYPSTFPKEFQPEVERSITRAELAFRRATKDRTDGGVFKAAFNFVIAVFAEFAHQACAVERQGHWSSEQLRDAVEEFLVPLTYYVYELTGMKAVQHSNGYWRAIDYSREVIGRVRRSDAWNTHLEERLTVADARTRSTERPAGIASVVNKDADDLSTRLASWLAAQMKERNLSPYQLHKQDGPDPKTTRSILKARGRPVTQRTREKLAAGLSKNASTVSINDIPS